MECPLPSLDERAASDNLLQRLRMGNAVKHFRVALYSVGDLACPRLNVVVVIEMVAVIVVHDST